MWNPLKKTNEDCGRLRDSLEEAAAQPTGAASVKSLTEDLTADDRKHLECCADCQQAIQDFVAAKELFQGAMSYVDEERPWFAARVMAAIASRQRELADRVSAWTEFPRFASRLTWVAAILLLAGTTWFYESVVRAPNYPLSPSQESIFETPQQSTPDDILVSVAGENP